MSMMEAIDKAIKERDWLRPEVERLQGKLEVAADGLLERDAEIERLRGLLSHWYEMWNDGIPNPDGDVLDDTVAALAEVKDA